MSEDRKRRVIAAYAVIDNAYDYEPWTDHEGVGWQRTTLDGDVDYVYLVVVDDRIELRHKSGNFNPPKPLYEWKPQTEREEDEP